MSSVLLKTVGCRLNQAESAELNDAFRARGAKLVDGAADVVVVNTCTVTSESSRTSRRLIRKAVAENPGAEVIVTGCYAVAAPDEVAAISGVATVVPNKDKDEIADRLFGEVLGGVEIGSERKVRRTLKVQTGCDESCTYCIVPTTRGRPSSRALSDVIGAGRRLAAAGVREITLSGVHLGKYGFEDSSGITFLVRELLRELPATVALRLSSIELTCVSDELIDLIAEESRVCRHLHIPLQSGDSGVLRAMGRPYTPGQFLDTAVKASRRIDGLALTTDVMVGFPGESDAAFENTLGAVREAGFMKLHAFRYSPRPGTPAAEMPAQVAPEIARDRSQVLRSLGDELRLEFHSRNALKPGRVTALVEATGAARADDLRRPALHCITDNYMKVLSSGPAGYLGEYVELEIEAVTPNQVKASPIDDQALRGSGRPG